MWNPLFIWSLKAGLILSFLFAAYYLLFRNNTQFQLKRFLQIVILLAAISFPLIKISVSNDTIPTVYAFQQLDISLTKENQVPTSTEALLPASEIETLVSEFSTADIIWWVYLAGVGLSAMIILTELTKLSYLRYKGNRELNLGENVISHTSVKYPFSFMKWIFVPTDSDYSEDDWRIVLAHENLHLQQKHTLDILFASFMQCMLWYHPAVYLIQKSLKANHEALADAAVLASTPYNQYSKTLLALSLRTNTLTLSHSFSLISSLSKRLKLMKIQKTSIKKTLVAAIILSGMISLTAFETMVYGQEDKRDEKDNSSDFILNESMRILTKVPIKTDSTKDIDGASSIIKSTKLMVFFDIWPDYTNLVEKLMTTYYSDHPQERRTFVIDLESERKVRYGQNEKLEFIKELNPIELEQLYTESKNYLDKLNYPNRTTIRIADQEEFARQKYLIITSYNLLPTSDPKFKYSQIFQADDVDVKPEPNGGIGIFINNIALNTKRDDSLNEKHIPEKIEFEFIVNSSGNITQLNLLSKIRGNRETQEKLYRLMGDLNRNILETSTKYGWKPAIKEGENVGSLYRIIIPKSLL
jgi:beta-lactamase regulating signal transducer with metallopeptidase domain